MRSNELTVEQADAIFGIIPTRFTGDELADAIRSVDEAMDTLLTAAAECSIDEFHALCIQARARLDSDGDGEDRSDAPNAPLKLRLHQLFNGRWSLSGDLSADDGTILHAMLDAALAAELWAKAAAEHDAGPGERDAKPEEPAPLVPRAQRMAATALRLIADGFGASAPGRAAIFLNIDLDNLQFDGPLDLFNNGSIGARTESNIDVSDSTLWAWFTGADVTPIFNQNGRPVSFGRTRRVAAPIQRRILAFRHQSCTVEVTHIDLGQINPMKNQG